MAKDATVYMIYLQWGHNSNTSLVQWVVLTVSFTSLKRLKNYIDIFSVKDTSVLLLNRPFNHAIKTKEKDSSYELLNNLSEEELKVLQNYLDNTVTKGWIWFFISFIRVLIMFVPKKDRGLCLCVNYHSLN